MSDKDNSCHSIHRARLADDEMAPSRSQYLGVSEESVSCNRALFSASPAGILIADDQRIIQAVNPAFCRLFGYRASDLVGQSTRLLHKNQEAFDNFINTVELARQGKMTEKVTECFLHQDGHIISLALIGAPICNDPALAGVVWFWTNDTAMQPAHSQSLYPLQQDRLTGLANRQTLESYLTSAIDRGMKNGKAVALGILDLDDFKQINDISGQTAGDELLKAFSQRTRKFLQGPYLLARMGGDEFGVIIEDIDRSIAIDQIEKILDGLHQVVETPFQINGHYHAYIEMTMGVAMYPVDGDDADTLIRKAIVTMYQGKVGKKDRTQWWGMSENSTHQPQLENSPDAFGDEAQATLEKYQYHFNSVTDQFAQSFYDNLDQDLESARILSLLSATDMNRLKKSQADHLALLLAPGTTRKVIQQRAWQIGHVHALIGISTATLTKAQMLYRRLLAEHLDRTLMPSRQRYRIMMMADARLQEDIQTELQSYATTMAEFYNIISLPLPKMNANWADVSRDGCVRLSQLPGIMAAVLMRPDINGRFTLEESAGQASGAVTQLMRDTHAHFLLDPEAYEGQSLTARAWRNLKIYSSPALETDENYLTWSKLFRWAGIRSELSIPILNESHQAVIVITIYGCYVNQFESLWMKQFAQSLQQRWGQIWHHCDNHVHQVPVPQPKSQALRHRLFTGGLELYLQPIVNLQTGQVHKFESLARLKLDNGEIVTPAHFLFLLGNTELDMLFRKGLDLVIQILQDLSRFDPSSELSLNVSPTTLLNPNCAGWIEQALQQSGIAPHRLTLELLEVQGSDSGQAKQALDQLSSIGIKLAMDDFGTGYSNLQRIVHLPFDYFKADQSLVSEIRENPIQTLALLDAIIQMGKDFQHEVIVEGLEDLGMIEIAANLGARYGQGFGIAKPMSSNQIPNWLAGYISPVFSDSIKTWCGALSLYWRLLRDNPAIDGEHPELLPLFQFLVREKVISPEKVTRLKQGIISGNKNKLMDLLVGKVRAFSLQSGQYIV